MSNLGVSVLYSDPIWKTSRAGFLGRMNRNLKSYSDVISATSGYQSASISLGGGRGLAEDWLEYGLGRHIECFNPSLEERWEGLVNSISVVIGSLTTTIGPFLGITNESLVKYTEFVSGLSLMTSSSSDTDSQAIYGTRSKVLNGGKVSTATAGNLRDTYIKENKYPESSPALGTPGEVSITLECVGYSELLDYPYYNSGTSTYTLREKLIDVVSNEPNGIFSSDTSRIEANTLSVYEEETEYRSGLQVIKDLLTMGGDGNNNRTIFGIYEGRIPVFGEVPTTVKYNQRLGDIGARLTTFGDQKVEAWEVEVGQWVLITDFLAGRDIPGDTFRADPRMEFIESVTFTAPNMVQINGGKTATLPQQLGKLGLGGLG